MIAFATLYGIAMFFLGIWIGRIQREMKWLHWIGFPDKSYAGSLDFASEITSLYMRFAYEMGVDWKDVEQEAKRKFFDQQLKEK